MSSGLDVNVEILYMCDRIIPYHILSYQMLSYHILSYHILSYHILSYLASSTRWVMGTPPPPTPMPTAWPQRATVGVFLLKAAGAPSTGQDGAQWSLSLSVNSPRKYVELAAQPRLDFFHGMDGQRIVAVVRQSLMNIHCAESS